MKKLFISYCKDDHEVVDHFMKHLNIENKNQENFLQIFRDKDGITDGYKWKPPLEKAINKADGYVFFVSINSLTAKYIEEKELPIIGQRYTPHERPVFLFLISNCSFEDYRIHDKDGNEILRLGDLQVAAPKQPGGRWEWFEKLPESERNGACKKAAETICTVMKGDKKQVFSGHRAGFQKGLESSSPKKFKSKPKIDNCLAFIDRGEQDSEVRLKLQDRILGAIVVHARENDWADGFAKRLSQKNLSRVDRRTHESRVEGRTHELSFIPVSWPALSDNTEDREKKLWLDVFGSFSITLTSSWDTAFESLGTKLNEYLKKRTRIVIHYRIESDNCTAEDEQLAKRLATGWNNVAGNFHPESKGRVILLISFLSPLQQEQQGFWSNLFGGNRNDSDKVKAAIETGMKGNVCDGSELPLIKTKDIDHWKQKLVKEEFSDEHLDFISLAVDKAMKNENPMPHGTLRKKVKLDEVIVENFHIY